MSNELKAKIRQMADEALNKGNIDSMGEMYAPNAVQHLVPFMDLEGLDAIKQYYATFRQTYSDLHITIEELIIEGDMVASRWKWQGKHTGESPFLPIPPTGKQVTVTGCNIARMQGGKVVEEWVYGDALGLMQQLGVIPEMEPSKS